MSVGSNLIITMAGIDKIYGTQEQYLKLEKWLLETKSQLEVWLVGVVKMATNLRMYCQLIVYTTKKGIMKNTDQYQTLQVR